MKKTVSREKQIESVKILASISRRDYRELLYFIDRSKELYSQGIDIDEAIKTTNKEMKTKPWENENNG